ncbi:MAG: M6 family metalloprotease domain-containing protein [Paludibacteraceae bacterium]|nr:M6 family metalloprotease domain-containing protein [Paludibacteraceae bacterium]
MKKIGLIVLLSAIVGSVWAVPARRGGLVVTQPDGSELTVYQHGDEHFHWLTNTQGEWLSMDTDGYYRVTEALTDEQIEAKRQAAPRRAEYQATPLNIATRGLIILVNFKDATFTTSKAEMDSMLTGKNYTRNYTYKYYGRNYTVESKGSAWKYFYDSSNGQYDPQFDVVGPVTVSQNMAYYGGNIGGGDKNPEAMIVEACKLVNDSVDFSLYDNDNDGIADFVYVIYAGYGEADGGAANTIWPHQYFIFQTLKLDNTKIYRYACSNEMDNYTKHHTGIGTFCHEFSHVLGLPDLYETTGYGDHKTMGEWSILDYGPYNNDGNTPPAYSAYERFFMGWLTPRLITEPENITLAELNESQEALLISSSDQHNLIGNDPDPTTFYLLENRQQIGWDEYLPGHGLMLTKIQYNYKKWFDNTVNNTAKSMGVDLIEADGKAPDYDDARPSNGYMGKAKDLFPAGATAYTLITDHPIEEITEENGQISFKYKGGSIETDIDNIENQNTILAIYNVLGQKQSTTDIEALPNGTYIVVNTTGSYKIVR